MKIHESREPLQVQDSNLAGSRLSNCSLAGAEFDDINLQGAAFSNISFAGATFTDVNMTNVRISDANLTGATINGLLVSDLLRLHPDHAGACVPATPPVFTSVMPVLRVADMQRAIDWYVQLLGFALQWRSPNDGGGENCMLRAGSVVLMLSTGDHLGGRPAFTGTLYFNTPAVAAFYERIKDQVDLVWPLQEMAYGTVEFGVRDPDGYGLAFSERPSPA